jgi:hypothetical protein
MEYGGGVEGVFGVSFFVGFDFAYPSVFDDVDTPAEPREAPLSLWFS